MDLVRHKIQILHIDCSTWFWRGLEEVHTRLAQCPPSPVLHGRQDWPFGTFESASKLFPPEAELPAAFREVEVFSIGRFQRVEASVFCHLNRIPGRGFAWRGRRFPNLKVTVAIRSKVDPFTIA